MPMPRWQKRYRTCLLLVADHVLALRHSHLLGYTKHDMCYEPRLVYKRGHTLRPIW
jgi:hypothetical protein